MSDYDLINGEIINVTITVDEETVTGIINTAARGPAGADGSGTNSITSATTSDGTANLSLSNVTTATATITGMSVAPTAATTTSTTQLATTAFVQQELASGVAVAKNLEFLAHNGTGATITKGSIVYINGALSGNPRITLAQANNDTNSARTIGFAKADIANGANGFVISEGELENVSTVDAGGIIGAGNQIYLSPTTPGAFTRTKPSAPNHLVYVGVVTRASTGVNLDGRILVGIQNGYELNELHDVAISSPAAKQVIKRNAGNTLWVNEAIVSADVSDATSAATADKLVLRDGTGGANFAGTVNMATGVISDLRFEDYQAATDATFSYGTNAASAHRIALGAGTTGAELFGAADAAAARTTLGLSLPIAVASGGTGNTNGSAATLTTPRTIGGSSFDGSANVTSFPSPGAIGATTASTGRFTTLTATSSGFIGTQAFTDASATLILSRVASAIATRLDIVGNNTYQDVLFIKTDVVSGTGTNWGFGQRADTFFGNTSGSFQIVGIAYVAGVEQSQYRVPLIAQPNGTLVLNGATANAISANVLVGTTTDPGTGKLHVAGSISSTGTISTTSATASTTTTTGALIVSGGVGIAGNINAGGSIAVTGTVRTGGYTFATLPTPTQGMRTFITDGAALPIYMANAAGGGSTVTPVFYNGTNWINA